MRCAPIARAGLLVALLVATVLTGCASRGDGDGAAASPSVRTPAPGYRYPDPPRVPTGPLEPAVTAAVADLIDGLVAGRLDREALQTVAASGDARLAWLVSDIMRFLQGGLEAGALDAAFRRLTGADPTRDPSFADGQWRSITNHLIAWELPAPPGYRQAKAKLFLQVEPGWAAFFEDANSDIDWRLVSWGGVLMDQRRLGDRKPCPNGCIPALDDPALTDAAAGSWYPDEAIVFGIVEGDFALALPKNIMEVHELVNVTLGKRRLGIPYCTLCASAQAYHLDRLPDRFSNAVLRTSGLLSRSNKIMYDLRTRSAFDTFTGRAVSGPLHDLGVTLPETTVVTSTWGEWRRARPNTLIVARDGGVGRDYPLDPLGGRDDAGPIFPVGDVDPRLPVQAQVVGVIAADGTPVAFDADRARAELAAGRPVRAGRVELVADGGGLQARVDGTGEPLVAHQAFWFAWSQFHPGTLLWP